MGGVGGFFGIMVYERFFGDPAGQKAKVEAKGEGDIEERPAETLIQVIVRAKKLAQVDEKHHYTAEDVP